MSEEQENGLKGDVVRKMKIIFYLLFAKFNSFNKSVTYILNFDKDFQIIFKKVWINKHANTDCEGINFPTCSSQLIFQDFSSMMA